MARFYEADTTDEMPVLINIDHIVSITPCCIGQNDGSFRQDLNKTTIHMSDDRFSSYDIDLPYETVIKQIKIRQDIIKEQIY